MRLSQKLAVLAIVPGDPSLPFDPGPPAPASKTWHTFILVVRRDADFVGYRRGEFGTIDKPVFTTPEGLEVTIQEFIMDRRPGSQLLVGEHEVRLTLSAPGLEVRDLNQFPKAIDIYDAGGTSLIDFVNPLNPDQRIATARGISRDYHGIGGRLAFRSQYTIELRY